jgi:hypothetical protein
MAPSLRRSAARTTLVSHSGIHHGDRSFLLVRERPAKTAAGECLALHGVFDQAVYERLHLTLLALSHSILPLVLDLNGVSALDEGSLMRLLKVQRELAPRRAVSFQIASDGPVPPLIRRLGLETRFGLEPLRPLPRTRTAVSPFPVAARNDAEKSINRDFIAT